MTLAAEPNLLPWEPLYSTTRADIQGVPQPEVTVYGVAYVWAENLAAQNNSGLALLRVGDTNLPLWSRSLLKPFQLMVLYPTLKQAYPTLTRTHFALLMASHQGDPEQLKLLKEVMAVGQLSEAELHCPACACIRGRNPQNESTLHHPCSGKHLAHLLYLKARHLPLENYLHRDQEPYHLLRELLCYLLYVDELPESVDGCGMPNLGLSAVELAQLYHALVLPVSRDMIRQCPDELTEILTHWDDIAALMQEYPELIGGTGRLDSRLMLGEGCHQPLPPLIAKEGAEGLLCLGTGPTERHAGGLGILIKLSGGYNAGQLEVMAHYIFQALGLSASEPGEAKPQAATPMTETVFHFAVQGVQAEV